MLDAMGLVNPDGSVNPHTERYVQLLRTRNQIQALREDLAKTERENGENGGNINVHTN